MDDSGVRTEEGRVVYLAVRVVGETSNLIGEPHDTEEQAVDACAQEAERRTHGRFTNRFVRGVSRRVCLRTGRVLEWPEGCGYEVHVAIAEEGEE